MKIFNSIGHFFAWILQTAIPKSEAAVTSVEDAATSPLADAITSLLGSKGAAVQAGLQAIAGDVLNAFGAAGEAIGAEGLNVTFDAATVSAIQGIYGDLKALFGKPATPAAAPTPEGVK